MIETCGCPAVASADLPIAISALVMLISGLLLLRSMTVFAVARAAQMIAGRLDHKQNPQDSGIHYLGRVRLGRSVFRDQTSDPPAGQQQPLGQPKHGVTGPVRAFVMPFRRSVPEAVPRPRPVQPLFGERAQ
jgi:hypothetical protein